MKSEVLGVTAQPPRFSRRAMLMGTGASIAATAVTLGTRHAARGTVTAAGPVMVTRSDAEVKFPTDVAFRLEAAATPMSEITAVSLLYRPVGTPTFRRVHLPMGSGGAKIALSYSLDTQVNFLPPGIDVEYRWLFTLSDGQQQRTDIAGFFYMDTRQQWRKTQNGQFTLWWYKGDDAFAKDAVDTAARAAARSKQTLNVTSDRPVRVLMYENTRDLRAALPQNSVEWVGGLARPDLALILSVVAPGRAANSEIRRVIPHEVSHQIAYQASENPYGGLPRWLDEGLAIRNQETTDIRFGPVLRDAYDQGKMIPLRALNSPFPLDETQALLSYAESESIVNYLINAYKPGTLGNFVAAFKDGLSMDQAVQQVLKQPLEGVEEDWKEGLRYGGDQRPGGGVAGP